MPRKKKKKVITQEEQLLDEIRVGLAWIEDYYNSSVRMQRKNEKQLKAWESRIRGVKKVLRTEYKYTGPMPRMPRNTKKKEE